jgi:branched-chain amino acid transport system permease protein
MLQLVFNGLAIGCIYALIALGFVLIYNAVGAVNFAQGDLLVVGSYFGVLGVVGFGWSLWPTAALVLVGSALVGFLFQAFAYYPLRDKPPINVVISCLGAGIFLRNGVQALAGPEPYTMAPFLDARLLTIFGVNIPSQNLAVILATLLILAFQSWLFAFTSLGRMLRATANDKYAARLCGIPVRKMIALTFVVSTVLAGLAGFMLVPIFLASPNMGSGLIVKAWIGVIVGGFGSLPGAVIGGILVGLLETFAAKMISSAYKDVITMMLLMVVLLVRPQGLFRSPVSEKV